jgi:2-(1,2-epoxy-1,2-dihydrophenyl)acetyl-CoA isomerase
MEPILLETQGNIAFIYLNRPEKFNSFNQEMAFLLQEKLGDCESNKEIRAIVLSGKGKAFCAGQDLAEAIEDNGIELPEIVERHYNPIISLLRTIEKPIICAVNGVAAGAGANIALACDIVLAKYSANFIQAFSAIGLIPDSGGTFFLPRLIGLQKAAAYMMLGDKISAIEAERVGMIYQAIPDETFESEVLTIATKLAQMPTRGIGLTKRLLNESFTNNLVNQLHREKEVQTEAGETHDFKEGVQAFLEKRKPQFTGS